jgi:hypothetical protein
LLKEIGVKNIDTIKETSKTNNNKLLTSLTQQLLNLIEKENIMCE